MKQALSLNSDEEGERETRLELATTCYRCSIEYRPLGKHVTVGRLDRRP
jgi:hypothetical protein